MIRITMYRYTEMCESIIFYSHVIFAYKKKKKKYFEYKYHLLKRIDATDH